MVHGFWSQQLVSSAALAQQSTDESVPTEEAVETTSILDAVIDLFGGNSSSEMVQPVPEVAPTQPSVSVPVPVNPVPQLPPASAETQINKVEIQTTYADAVREPQLHNRLCWPCGADWCVWCRKLEAELETPAAESILKEWVVVKVNVDNEPEVATRLQASALPAVPFSGRFNRSWLREMDTSSLPS